MCERKGWMNQTLQDISGRRSVRAFGPEQITEEELRVILEAGKAAPSSKNRQPWHFTVIRDKALLDWMVETNREIVLASPELTRENGWVNVPGYHNFYHAPTVILLSGQKENIWHACDCALAMENMALAAWSISVGSCIVVSNRFLFAGETAGEAAARLEIPEGYTPLYALALGYGAGDAPQPTPRRDDCINYIR